MEVVVYIVIFLVAMSLIFRSDRHDGANFPYNGGQYGAYPPPPPPVIIYNSPHNGHDPGPMQSLVMTAIFMVIVWFALSLGCNTQAKSKEYARPPETKEQFEEAPPEIGSTNPRQRR